MTRGILATPWTSWTPGQHAPAHKRVLLCIIGYDVDCVSGKYRNDGSRSPTERSTFEGDVCRPVVIYRDYLAAMQPKDKLR